MIAHLHRWLISALCCLAVAASAGEFEDGLEKIGMALAIPNTRDARQLQVTMPDVGMRLVPDFLPNGGRRSFGRSLRDVVWLWSADANRVDMVDIWGRELEVPLPPHLGGDTVRFKPISTRRILEVLAAEYRVLAALPPDPELPVDVSGGLCMAVHLQRRGETAAAVQIIRWCQALDRRPLREITRDALQVCYDAHYLFAWEFVRVYGDWRSYEDACDDILKRPSAIHWHHAEALRARLPQIEARALSTAPPKRDPYTTRDLKQIVEAMDRTGNADPDDAWPIAILGHPDATAYRKRHARQPLQMALFRQGMNAIPHLVALLGDSRLVPMSDRPLGAVGLPMTRGDVARQTLLATLPEALPPTTNDADLGQLATDFYRTNRQRKPVDLALLLLAADPQRFGPPVYAMLTETMPHDDAEVYAAIDGILRRHARATGTLWPDAQTYFRGLGHGYRDALDRYMSAYAAGLAATEVHSPAEQAALVHDARLALLKELAIDSDAALVEYLARHPSPLVGRSSGVDKRLSQAREPALRQILALLADPDYRDGWPELVAAFEVVARQGAKSGAVVPIARLHVRSLRREWRAALASDEPVVVAASAIVPIGQFLALSVEGLLASGTTPTHDVHALPAVREAIRQRALARIEGLTDDLLPTMPVRIAPDDPRHAALLAQLHETTAETLPTFIAALSVSELLTVQHVEATGDDDATAKLAPLGGHISAVRIAPRLAARMTAEELQSWQSLQRQQLNATTLDALRNQLSGSDLRIIIRANGGAGGTDLLVFANDRATTALQSLSYDRRWLVVAAIDVPTAEGKSTTMLWQSPDMIQVPSGDAEAPTPWPLWQGVDLRTMVGDVLALSDEEREAMAATWQAVTDAPDTWTVGTVLTMVAYAYGPDVVDAED